MTLLTSLLKAGRADPDNPILLDWFTHLELVPSSKTVYLAMLTKFFVWLQAKNRELETCKPGDILAFVDKLEKEHRSRTIRLIDRFYIHLAATNVLTGPNPASSARQKDPKKKTAVNDTSQFLSAEERQAVADYLGPRRREGKGKEEKKKASRNPHADWKEVRDRAIAAVILFGGAKVGEVAALSVNCISEQGEMRYDLLVPDKDRTAPNGRRGFRSAFFFDEGRPAVQAWLEVRGAAGIQGAVLFPSIKKGDTMHAASVYRCAQRVLEAALKEAGMGGPEARLSPQTLRNTYASMLMERNWDNAMIMDAMGLLWAESFGRIRAALADRAAAEALAKAQSSSQKR